MIVDFRTAHQAVSKKKDVPVLDSEPGKCAWCSTELAGALAPDHPAWHRDCRTAYSQINETLWSHISRTHIPDELSSLKDYLLVAEGSLFVHVLFPEELGE